MCANKLVSASFQRTVCYEHVSGLTTGSDNMVRIFLCVIQIWMFFTLHPIMLNHILINKVLAVATNLLWGVLLESRDFFFWESFRIKIMCLLIAVTSNSLY